MDCDSNHAFGIGRRQSNLSHGRVMSIHEPDGIIEQETFKLPPIKGVNSPQIGSVGNFYKKEKLKMAKTIARQEQLNTGME